MHCGASVAEACICDKDRNHKGPHECGCGTMWIGEDILIPNVPLEQATTVESISWKVWGLHANDER